MKKKEIKISPNSLDLYFECPLCFWLKYNKNIERPAVFPYGLNVKVDEVLKQDFDKHRGKRNNHPLLESNNIPAKLFNNQKLLNKWRDPKKGLAFFDQNLEATLFGVLDDILVFKAGELAPFDYKSTANRISKIYDRFQLQMDVYTYLLEQNGYSTPRKGILAFYIVDSDNPFKDKLPFRKEIHTINTEPDYVHGLFKEAVIFLKKKPPKRHSLECVFGEWFKKIKKITTHKS